MPARPRQLLTDLSRADWHVLDAFEDDLCDLALRPLEDGHRGWTYYVERCRHWRRWYEQQQPDEQVS